ncbi:MAG: hypothetical protein Q9Q13_11005 [Acidobacteriota bacterium]|nr:hypothetical protein [Acidobacteriota bacterium]
MEQHVDVGQEFFEAGFVAFRRGDEFTEVESSPIPPPVHVLLAEYRLVEEVGRGLAPGTESGKIFRVDGSDRQQVVDLLGAEGDPAVAGEAADQGCDLLRQAVLADGGAHLVDRLAGLVQVAVLPRPPHRGEG